jgi:formylglycine-generating enzyme required for sulfatase activity
MGKPPVADHPGDPILVDDFEIDRYEVTNQQYVDWLNEVLKTSPPLVKTSGGSVYDPGLEIVYAVTIEANDNAQITYDVVDSLFSVIPGREQFPMVEVSWFGADAYADYFGRRLPTEAEWEMTARGNGTEFGDSLFTIAIDDSTVEQIRVGKGRTYPWGEEPDEARANGRDSGDPFESQPRVRTTPVGFYNGEIRGGYQTRDGSTPVFGVHDLAGNVKEWSDDWYGPYADPHNPPIDGLHKIIRGGGWDKGLGSLQTWRRDIVEPTTTDWSIGFRTVRSIP